MFIASPQREHKEQRGLMYPSHSILQIILDKEVSLPTLNRKTKTFPTATQKTESGQKQVGCLAQCNRRICNLE
jgi:hypothetical protein